MPAIASLFAFCRIFAVAAPDNPSEPVIGISYYFIQFRFINSNTNQTPSTLVYAEKSPYHRLSSSIGVYVFKIHADSLIPQFPNDRDGIKRIPRESGYGFCQN